MISKIQFLLNGYFLFNFFLVGLRGVKKWLSGFLMIIYTKVSLFLK
ncbi:hypothetical protein THERMOT_671 [Bathymodiolus thermophilus thioautotrophic gill symbiont]|uniref:Uncharacterized protein n=1 Tax=Bathymodiolus thermophilus thioautotrophic gill symbiont TaxID=2360 RepID=A0A8H8XFH7_9GAMM|nr:hypothetical protein THERMOT_671 [Bathymodiolus thermophilus thioautotrophic gill symbiont]CAB5505769.1 hypothetical protein THERMOS_2182 [Bathymodiolus thermophilus thioautotrophic gill symbiont]